jgi:hypothetical protein
MKVSYFSPLAGLLHISKVESRPTVITGVIVSNIIKWNDINTISIVQTAIRIFWADKKLNLKNPKVQKVGS